LLQNMVEPIRRSLTERWSLTYVAERCSLLEYLLETVREPAFVLSESGRVEHANGAALVWLDQEGGASELAALRDALDRGCNRPGYVVARVDSSERPGCRLLLCRREGAATTDVVARAARLWSLSKRQVSVLEHVACGQSNKEVSAALGCAEVTVERSLTQLFRVSGAQSRTELVARLHQL
jgi:DNA-binding NarL/FixJ family response regulator